MSTFLSLQPIAAILELIGSLRPLHSECVPLPRAVGRVLAEDLSAAENLPGFDRSTVDGFAVQARDVFGASEGAPALLDLLGECQMGHAPDLTVNAGQCARIWTGGMLPPGADAVVMLEYAREAGPDTVELTRPVAPLENVLTKDEDVAAGQVVLQAGTLLSPQSLGLLAAMGKENVEVRQRPRVGVISSGDEVVALGRPLGPGQIRESNSYLLCALVEGWGGQALNLGLVGDDPDQLGQCLEQGLAQADALVITGGSSAGQRDFTLPVLQSLPNWQIVAHGIGIRPGKPTILARHGNRLIWGLPGNPTAAFITAHVFVREMLAALLGRALPSQQRPWLRAKLSRRVASALGRTDYFRVRLERDAQGDWIAHPLLGPSGLVSNPARAHGLIICPDNQEGLDQGQLLDVDVLDSNLLPG